MNNLNLDKLLKDKPRIIKDSVGLDYNNYELSGIGFDYEKMMNDSGLTLDDVRNIQNDSMVGNTPLIELKNITNYARKFSERGMEQEYF